VAQPIFHEGVNLIGMVAIGAMVLCWIGAVISILILFRTDAELLKEPMNIWREPGARGRFLRFMLFAVAALACVAVAIVFGGWPTGLE